MLLVFALTDVTTPLPPGLTHFDQITQSHDLLQRPPAVEPGLPVWEEGFSLLLPETACANHLSVGPCCLDPPQRLSMYFPSTNFQVVTPLTFQGACLPLLSSTPGTAPRDGQCPAAPCLGRWEFTGTETPAASLPKAPSTRIPSACSGQAHHPQHRWESTKQRANRQQCAGNGSSDNGTSSPRENTSFAFPPA